jgi:hypothetical protein
MPQPVISKTKSLPETPKQLQPQINDNRQIKQRTAPIPRTLKTKKPKTASKKVVQPGRNYSGKSYSKEEVENLIRKYSDIYGISSDTPRCIAFHESGYNQYSKNKRSSASGVFQYLSKTWRSTDEGRAGKSVFDADANVKAAVKYMASRRDTKPWAVRDKCSKIQPK